MKNARQENRENYLVFVQCGSDQMGCGDRSSDHLHFPAVYAAIWELGQSLRSSRSQ